MTELSITIDNRKLMQAVSQAPRLLALHLDDAVLRTVQEMARAARRKAPKGHSTLTQSINYRHPAPLVGEVVAGVDYARMVEEGTGPGGWPPEQEMIDWLRVKGITPNDPGMDLQDLAFVMARAIAINGTPAQPYMKPALDSNKARAERRINRAIDDALREMRA